MTKIKIAVAGCLGRMGQEITKQILKNKNLEFVGGFEHKKHKDINKSLNKVSDIQSSKLVTANSTQLIKEANVVIDFTTPQSTLSNVKLASTTMTGLVIGTTGITNTQKVKIKTFSKQLIESGTLSGGCYSSIHSHATELAIGCFPGEIVVGNVQMTMNSPEYLLQSKKECLDITRNLSKKFGKQCIVASIDYKTKSGESKVFFDRGRRESNYSLEEWAENCIDNGAGELYVTNIDFDGKRGGYDLEAISRLKKTVRVPIVLFGGAMSWEHFAEGLDTGASAVAAANIFHYKELASLKLRKYLLEHNYNVRELK